MLEYERIDVFGGIVVNKTNNLRKCIICYYSYFLEISFRFHPKVCDGCHDLMQNTIGFNNLRLILLKNDYSTHFLYMSKDENINLLRTLKDLTEKMET